MQSYQTETQMDNKEKKTPSETPNDLKQTTNDGNDTSFNHKEVKNNDKRLKMTKSETQNNLNEAEIKHRVKQ